MKKFIFSLFCVLSFQHAFIEKAYAVTVNTYYVDPDADAGGDGTTNALTGANCAFQSLSIWENARDGFGDLVGLNTIEECIVDSNGASHTADTGININGFTTGPTNYIYIHTPADSRHPGYYDTTKFRLENLSAADSSNMIINYEQYVRIDGLQMRMEKTTGTGYTSIFYNSFSDSASDIRCSNSILKVNVSSGYAMGFFSAYSSSQNLTYWNNVIQGSTWGNSTAIAGQGSPTYTRTIWAYNNTIVGWATALSGTGYMTASNNIIKGSGGFTYVGTFASSSTNNSTDSTDTMSGSSGTNYTSKTFSFVSTTLMSEDYHLLSSDTGAKDLGYTDFSGGLYSDDIDGETRSGSWDIGADEYVSAGGGGGSLFNKRQVIVIE